VIPVRTIAGKEKPDRHVTVGSEDRDFDRGSHGADHARLCTRIGIDVPRRHVETAMPGELLHVAETAASRNDAARRLGDEGAAPAMGTGAGEAQPSVKAMEPLSDGIGAHGEAARVENDTLIGPNVIGLERDQRVPQRIVQGDFPTARASLRCDVGERQHRSHCALHVAQHAPLELAYLTRAQAGADAEQHHRTIPQRRGAHATNGSERGADLSVTEHLRSLVQSSHEICSSLSLMTVDGPFHQTHRRMGRLSWNCPSVSGDARVLQPVLGCSDCGIRNGVAVPQAVLAVAGPAREEMFVLTVATQRARGTGANMGMVKGDGVHDNHTIRAAQPQPMIGSARIAHGQYGVCLSVACIGMSLLCWLEATGSFASGLSLRPSSKSTVTLPHFMTACKRNRSCDVRVVPMASALLAPSDDWPSSFAPASSRAISSAHSPLIASIKTGGAGAVPPPSLAQFLFTCPQCAEAPNFSIVNGGAS